MSSVDQIPKDTQVVVITGVRIGNLGHATLQVLLSQPVKQKYIVIITSRSLEAAQEAAKDVENDSNSKDALANGSKIVAEQCDIDDDESITKFKDIVEKQYGRIDILINNAGVNLDNARLFGGADLRSTYRKSFETNVISTHIFTEELLPLLFNSSIRRILFLTTSVSSLNEVNGDFPINTAYPAGWPKPFNYDPHIYRTSKAAMNMMILQLARKLKADNFTIHMLTPGLLATNLGGAGPDRLRELGAMEPVEGGKFLRKVIEGQYDDQKEKMLGDDRVYAW